MPDREKVIKGLECCDHIDCASCPYYDTALGGGCDMYDDALALLKEQEAVEPINPDTASDPWFRCGACKQAIPDSQFRFCPWCGRKIRWED